MAVAKKKTNKQHADLQESLSQAMQSFALREIRLLKSRVEFNPAHLPPEIAQNIGVSHSVVPNQPDSNQNILVAQIAFSLRGRDAGNDRLYDDFALDATFLMVYGISELTAAMTPELLQAFCQQTGVFQAWPYWREFFQSMNSRAGLGPAVIPMLTPAGLAAMKFSPAAVAGIQPTSAPVPQPEKKKRKK